MRRPGIEKLEADVSAGRLGDVVVWRVDRLGRTAAGVLAFLEQLDAAGVKFVAVRDGLDCDTFDVPVGHLEANRQSHCEGIGRRARQYYRATIRFQIKFAFQHGVTVELVARQRSSSLHLDGAGNRVLPNSVLCGPRSTSTCCKSTRDWVNWRPRD